MRGSAEGVLMSFKKTGSGQSLGTLEIEQPKPAEQEEE